MEWPDISVLIPTYNRALILRRTIISLRVHLLYSGRLNIVVGVDGDDNTLDVLERSFDHSCSSGGYVALEGPRRASGKKTGLGANLNMLIEATKADYLFQLDDDHQLVQDVNLDPHVTYMVENDNADWVRLMGIGSHHYTATLEGQYWWVHWDSSGPYSLYIPSNRPHVKKRTFHDYYGMYPEGESLGRTEELWCHQCRRKAVAFPGSRQEVPSVLVPLNCNSETAWRHVGHSLQQQGE